MSPSQTFAIAALLSLSLMAPAPAAPASAPTSGPTARDLHAARCVAALDVLTRDLAQEVRAGDAGARTVLMERLTAGAAFVGEAYLRGTSDEAQAKAARQRALQAQKSLPPAELAERQEACAREGAGLYASANAFQKFIVRRTAKRRMDKLLADPPGARPPHQREP